MHFSGNNSLDVALPQGCIRDSRGDVYVNGGRQVLDPGAPPPPHTHTLSAREVGVSTATPVTLATSAEAHYGPLFFGSTTQRRHLTTNRQI